jgi:hypothetical protein
VSHLRRTKPTEIGSRRRTKPTVARGSLSICLVTNERPTSLAPTEANPRRLTRLGGMPSSSWACSSRPAPSHMATKPWPCHPLNVRQRIEIGGLRSAAPTLQDGLGGMPSSSWAWLSMRGPYHMATASWPCHPPGDGPGRIHGGLKQTPGAAEDGVSHSRRTKPTVARGSSSISLDTNAGPTSLAPTEANLRLDYSQPPVPPLAEADAAWSRGRIGG